MTLLDLFVQEEVGFDSVNKIDFNAEDPYESTSKAEISNIKFEVDDLNKHSIEIADAKIIGIVDMPGPRFSDQFKLVSSFLTDKLEFTGGSIKGEVKFTNTYFKEKVVFDDVTFYGEVDFLNAKFLKDVEFIDCKFKKKVCFENTVFGEKVKFERCTFDGPVDFRLTDGVRDQEGELYYHKMDCDFTGSKFNGKVRFFHRHFKQVLFDNTSFNGLCDFYNTHFTCPTRFYKTDFNDTAVFSKAIFEKVTIFQYVTVKQNFILRDAKFKKGVNLAYINFHKDGNLVLFDVEINPNFESFPHKKNYDIDAEDDTWKKITHKQKRETFRILKHEAIKSNNKIEALRNHAYEMQTYKAELRNWRGFRRSFSASFKFLRTKISKSKLMNEVKLFWKKINALFKMLSSILFNWDLVILRFNNLSSSHGLNPAKGFLFTLLAGLVMYSIYLPCYYEASLDLSWSGVGYWFEYLKNDIWKFPLFLYPAHSFDFMVKDENPENISIIFDIVGRIFIGYGLYQTIQSFRKYGKF